MSRAAPFTIGTETIAAGERALVHLPIASLYSHDAPLTLPVYVIHGRRPGPVMFVSAAIHGDEINGVDIVRRLLRQRTMRNLAGTLLAIPVVNGFGMLQQSRYLPDRRDLNRSFPGSATGSLAARLANIFVTEIVARCQYGVDLHTGSSHRINLPQVRANLDDEETLRLANAFGVPVIIHSTTRDGSLREIAMEQGIKMLLFEAGEALRFSELAVRVGLRGILQLMRHVAMLPASRSRRKLVDPFIARSSSWVRAPRSGVLDMRVHLGAKVGVGDVLARVYDPFNLFEDEGADVVGEKEGIIVGMTQNPLVHEGDAIVHVARFKAAENVAEEVGAAYQEVLEAPRLI
ncbi:MAG: succinylglutamate desuccinylase/aspartoacylase family protein [Pseudomonadales bacterium]|nr:succinylglutamate desuccinylase/aspartoacylase family protein [Pseudomonadales bacterium]